MDDTREELRKWAEHERREQVERARAELRAKHERLTDQQIDLVAEVMADVRLASLRIAE